MSAQQNVLRVAAALAGATGLAACGDYGDEDYDDIATGIAALLSEGPSGEREALRDCSHAGNGYVPDGFVYDEGGMHGRRGELDYDFRMVCVDMDGIEQVRCNAVTEWANLKVTWDGRVETWRHTADIYRTVDWTLTDLWRPIAKLSGTGTFDVKSTFKSMNGAAERAFDLTWDATYTDVKVRTADRAIISGTADYEILARRMSTGANRRMEMEKRVNARVLFDDSDGATFWFDARHRYWVDLSTGRLIQLGAIEP